MLSEVLHTAEFMFQRKLTRSSSSQNQYLDAGLAEGGELVLEDVGELALADPVPEDQSGVSMSSINQSEASTISIDQSGVSTISMSVCQVLV